MQIISYDVSILENLKVIRTTKSTLVLQKILQLNFLESILLNKNFQHRF